MSKIGFTVFSFITFWVGPSVSKKNLCASPINGKLTWLEAVTYHLSCVAHFWRRGQDTVGSAHDCSRTCYCAECLVVDSVNVSWVVVLRLYCIVHRELASLRIGLPCVSYSSEASGFSGQGVQDLPVSSWLFSAAESGFHSRWATLSGWFFCVSFVNLVLVSGLCLQCYFRLRCLEACCTVLCSLLLALLPCFAVVYGGCRVIT